MVLMWGKPDIATPSNGGEDGSNWHVYGTGVPFFGINCRIDLLVWGNRVRAPAAPQIAKPLVVTDQGFCHVYAGKRCVRMWPEVAMSGAERTFIKGSETDGGVSSSFRWKPHGADRLSSLHQLQERTGKWDTEDN